MNSSDITYALRVLLVEDSLLSQMLMETHLATQNCPVTIAANGQEAVDLMTKMEFDLVLMDVQMPIMDGLSATRLIRKREADAGNLPCLRVGRGWRFIARAVRAYLVDRACLSPDRAEPSDVHSARVGDACRGRA